MERPRRNPFWGLEINFSIFLSNLHLNALAISLLSVLTIESGLVASGLKKLPKSTWSPVGFLGKQIMILSLNSGTAAPEQDA